METSIKKWFVGNYPYAADSTVALPAALHETAPMESREAVSPSASPGLRPQRHAVNERYARHFGNTDRFLRPVTRKDALKSLQYFVQHSLPSFGDFQDAVKDDDTYPFHSLIGNRYLVISVPAATAPRTLSIRACSPAEAVTARKG